MTNTRYMLWVELNHPVTTTKVDQVLAWMDRLEPLAPYVQLLVSSTVIGMAQGVYPQLLAGPRRKLKIVPGVKTNDQVGGDWFAYVDGWAAIANACWIAVKQARARWCLLDNESAFSGIAKVPTPDEMKLSMGMLNAVPASLLWYPFNAGARFEIAKACFPHLTNVRTVGTEWKGRQGYDDALTLVRPRKIIPLHWTNTANKLADLGNHIQQMHASGARVLIDQPGWGEKTDAVIDRLLELFGPQ